MIWLFQNGIHQCAAGTKPLKSGSNPVSWQENLQQCRLLCLSQKDLMNLIVTFIELLNWNLFLKKMKLRAY